MTNYSITACVLTIHCAYEVYTFFHCLLCRPAHPQANPVSEYEYVDSGRDSVVQEKMTRNPSYVMSHIPAKGVTTSFSSGPKEDKEVDHTYDELPFEANKEGPKGTACRDAG